MVETSSASQTRPLPDAIDLRNGALSAPPRTQKTDRRWFRGDVDGIRAIAIVLVVAYHAKVPHLHGGFIGVDVFFVISGFLISRNLLAERDKSGRIALGRFWARRVRRLVPALALVVAVTLVASYFVLPLYQLGDVAKQGAAASLYVSNLLFASQARDYFAADVTSSPFLHTWSLGVEEQFYLVWPVLVALATWITLRRRRSARGRDRRTLLLIFFGLTFVLSLGLNVVLTNSGNTWAFFGLPSRAWEFAVAGLLATVPTPRLLRSVAARSALAVAGLVVLAIALKLIDDATPYPGLWALLPVSATVLLIVAGETWGDEVAANPVSRGLSVAPMQWLGRVSYSWYLWHWPAIVLLVVAVDSNTTGVRSLAALATLPVAFVAYRWFETPLRFSPLIARSNPRTFVFGAVVTVAVVALAFVVWPDTTSRPKGDTLTAADFEAPSGASLEERVAVTVEALRSRVECPKSGAIQTSAGTDYCVGGDPEGDRTLLLLGDSHAGQWRRPLEAVAKAHHVKLLIRQHSGCPPYPVLVTDPVKKDQKTKTCKTEQAQDMPAIDELKPDAVLIATWSGNRQNIVDADGRTGLPDDEQVALWDAGVRATLGELAERKIPFGVILDEPDLPDDPMKCISKKDSIAACEDDRATALATSGPLLDVERRVLAEMGGVPTIDMTSVICDAQRCPLEIDGTFVWADTHHLTDAFVLKHQGLLDPLVTQLVG